MDVDNRISLQKLQVFCKVAELGGVRRAGEELYISQPVVSAHLRSLRERVDAKLFYRDGRGIRLTEAGWAVYRWASEVLRSRVELAKNLENLSDGVSGSVTIGASMSVGNSLLPQVLIGFKRTFPCASITLQISPVEFALESALAGGNDFCVVGTDAVLDGNAFEAELVGRPRLTLIASVDNAEIPEEVTAEELAELSFVSPPEGLAIRRSQDSALSGIGVRNRRVAIELGSAESIKQAVAADLGVGLLWHPSVAAEIEKGALREVRVVGPPMRDNIYVVQRAGKRLTHLQSRLREDIRSNIAGLVGSS